MAYFKRPLHTHSLMDEFQTWHIAFDRYKLDVNEVSWAASKYRAGSSCWETLVVVAVVKY